MPALKKVNLLPDTVRAELDQRIVAGGFGGYVDLSEWLADRGFGIGKSALAEHGKGLERRIEMVRAATQQAETLVAASPDDEGAVAEATLRLAQQQIFDIMVAGDSGDLMELSSAIRAIAESAKATVSLRDAKRRAKAEVSVALEAEARRQAKLPASSPAEMAEAFRKALTGA